MKPYLNFAIPALFASLFIANQAQALEGVYQDCAADRQEALVQVATQISAKTKKEVNQSTIVNQLGFIEGVTKSAS